MMKEFLYYTGAFVWGVFIILGMWLAMIAFIYLYKNHIKQTLGNLRFIMFGSKKINSYHEQWRKYSKSGIRKFWQTRKYLRKYAWRSLVRRAWKERNENRSFDT